MTGNLPPHASQMISEMCYYFFSPNEANAQKPIKTPPLLFKLQNVVVSFEWNKCIAAGNSIRIQTICCASHTKARGVLFLPIGIVARFFWSVR